jgi:hypothetical protein
MIEGIGNPASERSWMGISKGHSSLLGFMEVIIAMTLEPTFALNCFAEERIRAGRTFEVSISVKGKGIFITS